MTGNATEEWLISKLDYPGHNDASRMAGLSGSSAGIVGGLTVKAYLGAALGVVCGLVLGFAVGAVVYNWLNRRAKAREVERLFAEREHREAEADRQISRMKSGS